VIAHTIPLSCPLCGVVLQPETVPRKTPPVSKYELCLRRCDSCGVGYSNASTNPTLIYKNPIDNIPAEVRQGVKAFLDRSLSKLNHQTKWRRFGFSTSEDAVTWVVFSFLALQAPSALSGLGQRLLGFGSASKPTMLLWGAPVPATNDGDELRVRLIDILDSIGEDKKRRSEPDVVLDYGASGVAFIEVKLHAVNDVAKPADAVKFAKYLSNTSAFGDATLVKASRMYELTRNWRIGWDLAGQRPFRLVNLGPATLFKQSERLDSFEKGLTISTERRFQRLSWSSLLECAAAHVRGLPSWLADWLELRGLKVPNGVV
jgi:hypothetical protein